MCMAPETHASFVESRETDRRFMSIDDAARGIKKFDSNTVTTSSKAIPVNLSRRSACGFFLKQKAGNKVLEWHGTDFEPVRVKGSDEFMMKPSSSGGHERRVVSYLHSSGVMIEAPTSNRLFA